MLEKLSQFAEQHKWAFPFALPFLLIGILLKIPQALKEWGES